MKRLVSMREALDDPQLLGASLPGPSWATWRTLLIAAGGEALDKGERQVFRQFTGGREREPGEPIDTFLAVAGRRSGKTTAFAAIVVYYSCLIDWADTLALGERGTALFLAPKQEQAMRAARYVRAFIEHSPIMSKLILNQTQTSLELSNGIDVLVEAANWRTVRGATCVAVCLDECAFLRNSEDSMMRDEDLVTALRPSLVTTSGPMLLISSPGTDVGIVHAIHRRHYGPQGDSAMLVVQSDSRALNPRLSQARIDREYAEDPEAAQAEWGGQFRAPTTQYLPRHVIEAAVSPGVQERPPVTLPGGFMYHAFVDAAGGSGKDSFALCIGHHDPEKRDHVVVDALREWKPPFNSEVVVEQCAAVLRLYGIRGVAGDMYAKGWPTQSFARHGIEYAEVNQSASDLYLHVIPVFTSGRVQLLDVPRVVEQFLALRRKVGTGGRETIQHLRSGHDDVANATAGLIWKLTPTYASVGVIASPGLYVDGIEISAPRIYRLGQPSPPAPSPREAYEAALMRATHEAAGGNGGEYGDRGLQAGQGWRRFDYPGDNRSW